MKTTRKYLLLTLSYLLITFSMNAQCLGIVCSSDVSVILDSTDCTKDITYPIPGGYDACNSDTITYMYSGIIDRFVVPTGINSIKIEAWGASGGNSSYSSAISGGLGAYMSGTFAVTPGQVLHLLVGQAGENDAVGGGGGGTFVVDSATQTPLLVAGGGGGASSEMSGIAASITGNGTMDALNIIAGGTAGNGGQSCATLDDNNGGAGGGFYTNGADANSNIAGVSNGGFGGLSFLNGGTGGAPGRLDGACSEDAYGGFGGGGSTSCNTVGGGGGGGYSGGAGGLHLSNCGSSLRSGGGGGGSFNSGTNPTNLAGANTGDGMLEISYFSATGVTSTLISGLGSGSTFPIGTTVETYVISLGSESDTCSLTVTVADTISPQFDFDLTDSTFCGTPSGISAPSVTDNCTNTITYSLTGATSATGTGDAGQETFNPGITVVNYLVTDESGNTDTLSFSVMVNNQPVLTIQGDTTICQEYGAITLSASPSGGNWTGNGLTGSVFDPTAAGSGISTLTYSYTTSEGCTETASVEIEVTSCASVGEIDLDLLTIYPNPATDILHVKFKQVLANATLIVYDLNGREILEKDASFQQTVEIDVNAFTAGVYLVKLNSDLGEQYLRFVKK